MSTRRKSFSVPDGFQRFSDAVCRLAEGMWGGLRGPVPVRAIKRIEKRTSIGFGPWREQAAQRLTAEVKKGRLEVYVSAKSQAPFKSRALARCSPQQLKPVTVPVTVLARLITRAGASLITRSDRRSRLHRAMKSCSGYSRPAFSLSVPAILRSGTGRNALKANGPHNVRD
jgi:hypothetical protein